MSEDTWYFAYGSNLNIGRKEERTGSIRESHVAKLAGYRLAFNKRGSNGEAYANLLANPTEEVLGVVYRCSEQAICELDRFEGVANGHYRRCTSEVELVENGLRLEAQVYVAEPEFTCEETPPSEEYLSHILRGVRTHRFPSSYTRMIRIRAGKESCGEGKRLWRTHIVDAGLQDSWLGALNALRVFDLISICEGHPTSGRNTFRSIPHINLRVKPHLLPSATRRIVEVSEGGMPQPKSNYLASRSLWTMEFRRRLTPRRNDELSGHDDEIVVSINSMSRVDSNSGRENAVDWFEQIMPELLSYDSMLYRTLIGEVGI
jgi:gamma-glutamylcyclotransferase